MIKFILEILIFLSLGAAVYLVARSLPRINDEDFQKPAGSRASWLMPYLEKADELLKVYLERFLRRLKVFVMRLDNWVSQKLANFKKEGKEANFSIHNLSSENNKGDNQG